MRTMPGIVLVAAGLAIVGAPTADAAPGDQIRFTFDSGSLAAGHTPRSATNLGSADVTARVVRLDQGEATRAKGHGRGNALRFPRYGASSHPPRAVLRVTNAGSVDQLNPGDSAFSFGADVKLRALSEGTPADNGNNLVQRGLFSDVAQYKLDVDGRRPGCRVKGDLGSVSVRSGVGVNSQDWYRVVCTRDVSGLTLRVVRFLGNGSRQTSTKAGSGPTGSLVTASAAVPLSVAGKLDAQGRPVPSTDQLNGVVDRVFLHVAP